MDSSSIWAKVIVFAWLLCVGSFVVYAYYAGWIGRGFLANLEKNRLYLLLRFSRTSALLFISVSIIAFMYFETDVFPKRILDVDVEITQEQYEAYLKQRHQSIVQQLKYAPEDRKGTLAKEKTEIEKRLEDPLYNYGRYVEWLYHQMSHLSKLRDKVPSRLLNRSLKSLAAGDMIEIDLAIDQIENFPGIDYKDAAMLAFMRGSLARWSLHYRQSYEHYARSARLAGDNPRFHTEAGLMAFRIDDYRASLSHYESALKAHLQKHGEYHPEVASDYSELGRVWEKLGDDRKVYHYFEKALKIDLKNYPENHPILAEDNTDLGLALGYLEEYWKAVPYFEKALDVNLKQYGEHSPAVMSNYEHLGWAWKNLEDYRRSAFFYEKALAVCLKLYGEDHMNAADYRDTLGWLWGELGEYGRSLAHYEPALNAYREHYGETHPDFLRIRRNLKAIKTHLARSGRF